MPSFVLESRKVDHASEGPHQSPVPRVFGNDTAKEDSQTMSNNLQRYNKLRIRRKGSPKSPKAGGKIPFCFDESLLMMSY